MGMGIEIDSVRDSMISVMDTLNTDLASALDKVNQDPSSTSAMFELQFEIQRWSTGLQTQSNTIKALGDSLKAVVQNLS